MSGSAVYSPAQTYTRLIFPILASALVTVPYGCACVPSALASSPVGVTNTPNSSEITQASASGPREPSHAGGGAPPLPAAASVPPSPLVAELPPAVPDAPPLPLA